MDVDTPADLYGLDPGGFVAARDALARRLRAAGDKDEAARVKALRRPSVAAWALNTAARSDRALVDDLLDAAGAARKAHDDVLGGASGDVLREALARRRTAVGAVAQRARRALEDAGRPSDTQQRDIDALLEHALDSAEAGAALRAGVLTGELDREGDADDLLARLAASVTEPRAAVPAKKAAAKAPARAARPTKQLAAARKEVDRRRAAVADAERAVTAADRAVAKAAAALAAASAAHTDAVADRETRSRALAEASAALADAEETAADLDD